MGRIFKAQNVESKSTIFGASEFVVEMVQRLNSMAVSPNAGHTGTFRGGGPGTFGQINNSPFPAVQNFGSPSVMQSLGNIRGQRAGANQGLPNTQAPGTGPRGLLNLLLPISGGL